MKPGIKNHIRKNTSRERCWRLMRTLGNYTLTEVATLAEADVENIRHYHQCLISAGYVKQVGTKRQEGRSGFDKVYRLVKNTGPKPPVQKSLRFLFDPNTSEYWAADPELMAQTIIAVDVVPSPDNGTKKIRIYVKPGSFLDRIEKGLKEGRHVD
jgi:hypothetical protein